MLRGRSGAPCGAARQHVPEPSAFVELRAVISQMGDSTLILPGTFQNPVYNHSFPDPFVLKYEGVYYAFCTGFGPDGKVFPIPRSPDLVNWTPRGSAMEPLASAPPYYWAPEVTAAGGKFYLYYSVG